MAHNLNKETSLKTRLQQILAVEKLDIHRDFIKTIIADLEIDSLTCAAALVYLTNQLEISTPLPIEKLTDFELPTKRKSIIKMLRYRLDVGSDHSITPELLKKVLIEESGVDKNNITNINIQRTFTLIELPDEMPQDIFQHLKSVEINQHKLDIKRVKTRNNKKRGNNHLRRNRNREANKDFKNSDKTNSCNSNKKVD